MAADDEHLQSARSRKWNMVLKVPEQTTLLWVVPDFSYLDFFVNYLVILTQLIDDAEEPPVKIKIFFTGAKESTELSTMLANVLAISHYTSLGGSAIEIVLGRPNFKAEVEKSKPAYACGCGVKAVMDQVGEICADAGVSFEAEEFQDMTLGKLWGGFSKSDRPQKDHKANKMEQGSAAPALMNVVAHAKKVADEEKAAAETDEAAEMEVIVMSAPPTITAEEKAAAETDDAAEMEVMENVMSAPPTITAEEKADAETDDAAEMEVMEIVISAPPTITAKSARRVSPLS